MGPFLPTHSTLILDSIQVQNVLLWPKFHSTYRVSQQVLDWFWAQKLNFENVNFAIQAPLEIQDAFE